VKSVQFEIVFPDEEWRFRKLVHYLGRENSRACGMSSRYTSFGMAESQWPVASTASTKARIVMTLPLIQFLNEPLLAKAKKDAPLTTGWV
jgi:hypothetical protein